MDKLTREKRQEVKNAYKARDLHQELSTKINEIGPLPLFKRSRRARQYLLVQLNLEQLADCVGALTKNTMVSEAADLLNLYLTLEKYAEENP